MIILRYRSLIAVLATVVVLSFASSSFAGGMPSELFKYVPDTTIFFAYSGNIADAYNNYIAHGIELAVPKLRVIRENYERNAGTTIANDASLSSESVIALTDVNLALFNIEFVQIVRVSDVPAFEKMLDTGSGAAGISRKSVTKIAGREVFALSSPKIKTPLFYLFDGTYAVFSNKLEGLSKSLEVATSSKNFSKTTAFEQTCRKYPLDSNLYFWLSGKVISNYLSTLNLVNVYPAFMKTDENVRLEKMVRIINDFVKALEFIAIKVNIGPKDVEIDFFMALNELLAKTIKARLQFVKPDDHNALSYEGIQLESLKAMPEWSDFAAAAHVVLPPIEELHSAPIANASQDGGISVVDMKTLDEKLKQKFGAGIEKLVYSWASNEFFVAGSKDRGMIAGGKIKDSDNLEAVLRTVEKKVAKNGYKKSFAKHSDVKITVMKKVLKKEKAEKVRAYFVIGDLFILADSIEAAKASIDAYRDKTPSIRAYPGFAGSCGYVSTEKYKLVAFARTTPLLNAAAPYLNSMLDITTLEPQLMNLRNVGIMNSVTRDGQHFRIRLTY